MAIIGETNITMSSVRDTLNGAGGSVGNDLQSFFSSSAKLNMWSRYKPVIISKVPFINLWENNAFKADGLTCGITIPFYTDYTTLQSELKAGRGGWSYAIPTGGENAPMRLGDFRRYNTNAINPIGAVPGSYNAVRIAGTDYIDINIELNVENGNPYNLGVSDLSVNEVAMTSMYLGVYLVKKSGNKTYFRTCPTPIGTNKEFSMRIPLDYGEGGTFTAYMFVSSLKQEDNFQGGGVLASLNKPAQTITIKAAGTLYVITAQADVQSVGGKTFNYYIVLYNNNNASTTFKNVYVRIQHYIDGTWQNEGNPVLVTSSKTVSANSKAEIEGTGTHSVAFNLDDLESGKFRIYAYSETPSVTGDASYIEAPSPK